MRKCWIILEVTNLLINFITTINYSLKMYLRKTVEILVDIHVWGYDAEVQKCYLHTLISSK